MSELINTPEIDALQRAGEAIAATLAELAKALDKTQDDNPNHY